MDNQQQPQANEPNQAEQPKTRKYIIKQTRIKKGGEVKTYEYEATYKVKSSAKKPEERKKAGPHFKKTSSLIAYMVEKQSEAIQKEILAFVEGICLREITKETAKMAVEPIVEPEPQHIEQYDNIYHNTHPTEISDDDAEPHH